MKNPDIEYTETVNGIEILVQAKAEPEQESYESVYGEAPPDGYDYVWVQLEVTLKRDHEDFHGLASIGMVDIPVHAGYNQCLALLKGAIVEYDLKGEAMADLGKNVKHFSIGYEVEQAKMVQADAQFLLTKLSF